MRASRIAAWSLAVLTAAGSTMVAGSASASPGTTQVTTPTSACAFAAHRGDHAGATENSLNAFRRAVADGATYVEMDVRTTSDGVLALMHDPTVDRTTRGHGAIADLPWRQVKALRLDDGQHVPSLARVLAKLKSSPVQAFIEIKSVPDAELPRLTRRIDAFGVDRVIVNSFDPDVLLRFKAANPDVRTARDVASAVAVDDAVAYGGVMVDYRVITDDWLAQLTDADVPVYAWTVDASTSWRRLIGSVNVIITNRPRAYALYRRAHCPSA